MASTASPAQIRVHSAPLMDHRNPRAAHLEVFEPGWGDERAARGNLYILIELIGSSPVGSHAVREMQATAELTYYSAGGPVSQVLKQAIADAHEVLRNMNRNSPDIDLQAGIICAAVVQGHLIIASAGPTVAFIASDQRLEQFPLDEERFSSNVGGETEPNIHTYRRVLNSGDALFLGESEWILQSDVRTIGGAVVSTTESNMQDVVLHLQEQGDNVPLLGLLLVFAEEELAEEQGDEETVGTPLPTAVGAAPPVRNVPGEEGAGQFGASRSQVGVSSPELPSAATMQHQLTVPVRPRPSGRDRWRTRAFRILDRPSRWFSGLMQGLLPERKEPQSEQSQEYESEESAPSPQPAPSLQLEPSPQPAPSPQPMPSPQPAPPDPVVPIQEAPPLQTSESPAEASAEERIQLPALPGYAPPAPSMGNRRRLIIAIAILIPLLTSAVVGAAFLREGSINQEEGLQLVELADSKLLEVQQALAVDDKTTARASLSEAQRYLDEAIVLIGVTDQIQELSEVIATELQELLQTRALYSLDVPLLEYSADAEPQRIVVSNQDIYVLDSGQQAVSHYRANSERTMLEEDNGAILKEGDTVPGGMTVGRLVDIAWQPRISGFEDKASLLILDRNNNVFRYNRLDGATHLVLREQSSLGSVGQLGIYNGRLYLADERSDQIFRYTPAGLAYDDPPTEWFDEQVQGDLAGLIAMGIDGDIWLLSEDGTLLRFREGQQLPFSLERIPGLGGLLVDFAMAEHADGMLFLADATDERILVYDKEGRYIQQFVDAEDLALAGLRGLFLDEVSDILYILTKTGLYAHPLPR
ncbi:MAG: hypothetical protein F4Y42_04965 [Caldilineaceae bacterium SB0664_bin_27]|uniref:PPM-type phosphatase domain-containing protein n=1 Tax=Caldilineaceae bacterium SB0664_bin_27 TaxID=2605260 RepID=A0A6B0YP08_9CHLR|nr:hypothetical protein [Caldilineaceae bacterium SB0664_bin_27]